MPAVDPSFFKDKPYIIRGIIGQTTSQMLVRFRSDVINLKPAAVIILAGINDIAENTGPITLGDILGNIISMTELAEANNIEVILCSVLPANKFDWSPEIKPAEQIIKLNKMIKAYANKKKLVYIDYYSVLADQNKGLRKELTKDGVHPILVGYKIMEPILEKGIAKFLKDN